MRRTTYPAVNLTNHPVLVEIRVIFQQRHESSRADTALKDFWPRAHRIPTDQNPKINDNTASMYNKQKINPHASWLRIQLQILYLFVLHVVDRSYVKRRFSVSINP